MRGFRAGLSRGRARYALLLHGTFETSTSRGLQSSLQASIIEIEGKDQMVIELNAQYYQRPRQSMARPRDRWAEDRGRRRGGRLVLGTASAAAAGMVGGDHVALAASDR